jgi:hypothetical protein
LIDPNPLSCRHGYWDGINDLESGGIVNRLVLEVDRRTVGLAPHAAQALRDGLDQLQFRTRRRRFGYRPLQVRVGRLIGMAVKKVAFPLLRTRVAANRIEVIADVTGILADFR